MIIEYQLEHLLHSEGWKITDITDISEEYPRNKSVFLVDIVNVNEIKSLFVII